MTELASAYLAEKGYDPSSGARPLRRIIRKEIEDALALELLQGAFAEGDRVIVDRKDDGLTFRKA